MMGVSVKHHIHGIAGQGLLQAAGSEIRVNLEWLSEYCVCDGRIVKERHFSLAAETAQRGLQLQGLVHRLSDELLDQRLSPRAQRSPSKSSCEALHARKADTEHLAGVAVQQRDAGIAQDARDLGDFAAFVIVIAEHRYDRE